jgi:CHASE2 domain-containing sensor protein
VPNNTIEPTRANQFKVVLLIRNQLKIQFAVRRIRSQIIPTILILFVSMSAVIVLTWLVPSLAAATLNMLFRLRAEIRPPDDIVIVAIDDSSLQQVGAWPWPVR